MQLATQCAKTQTWSCSQIIRGSRLPGCKNNKRQNMFKIDIKTNLKCGLNMIKYTA